MSGSIRKQAFAPPQASTHQPSGQNSRPLIWLAALAGACFGVVLNKLGTPVVIPSFFDVPSGPVEAMLLPWPMAWGLVMLAVLAFLGFLFISPRAGRPAWLFWMPALWLAWQFAAHTQSMDPVLSGRTVTHFTALVVSFYLGWLVLARLRQAGFFFGMLVLGFFFVLLSGFQQRYGELEQTRRYVEEHERSGWRDLPQEELQRFAGQGVLVQTHGVWSASPEFLKRLGKGRVYGTFGGYPNALASGVILLLPVSVTWLWQVTPQWPLLWRRVLVGALAYMGMACLYWTRSKAGWLVALLVACFTLWHLCGSRRWKYVAVSVVLGVGLTAFAVKFSDYFQKGATSVGARWACWMVAVENGFENPVFGTGPGTFGPVYQSRKNPEAEMAKLAHNDYIEQWTDSGLLGFFAYILMTFGSIFILYRKRKSDVNMLAIAVWLGLFGWMVQGLVEFTLYIPALAWNAFVLLGWSLGRQADSWNRIDMNAPSN